MAIRKREARSSRVECWGSIMGVKGRERTARRTAMHHSLTTTARAVAPAGAGHAVGRVEETIVFGSAPCHALVYVRIFRHMHPASRRLIFVAAMRARDSRRAHEHQSQ